MVLSVLERLLIVNLFPGQGKKIAYQRAASGIRNKVGLTAEEIEEYEVENNDGRVTWRPDLPQEKDINLTGAEIGIIATELKEQDDNNSLTADHLSLWEKFIEE